MTDNPDHMITWNDNDSTGKAKAFEQFSGSIDAYEGVSKAYHREYLDIEPNRSVRPSFTAKDYYAFRPEEEIPRKSKRIIKMFFMLCYNNGASKGSAHHFMSIYTKRVRKF